VNSTTKPKTSKTAAMIEAWGGVFIGVMLSIFAVEMLVLITLIERGVPMDSLVHWLVGALPFGWGESYDVESLLQTAGSVGLAYAITRLMKPFSLALTFFLTPIVGKALGKGPKDD